jgi:serine/threonine-protein kinase
MTTTADPRIGSELAGYRIERPLGRGGMSVVYLAEHLRLRRKVALKLLAPEISANERFRERFLRESEVAASLDHPNVIPIYDADEADGLLYIAMRYVDGTDLKTLLVREGALTPSRAVALTAQVAEALDVAHEHGLVHRDVKPGNVLVALQAGREHCYLADFGLTKQTSSESGLTETGQFIGTADYVSPEQIERRPATARSDQYALTCVLYECLAGEPPYRSESFVGVVYAHLNIPPPSLHERRPELPLGVDPVLGRGMAKDPDDRYPSCRELVDEARRELGVTGDLPVPPPAPTFTRKRLLLAAGGVIAIAAAAAVPAVLLTRGDEPTAPPLVLGVASLVRIDPATDGPVAAISVGAPTIGLVSLTAGGGAAWLASPYGGTVSRIDTRTNEVTRTVSVPGSPTDVSVGAGGVWVVGYERGTSLLTRIDPAAGVVRRTFELPDGDPVGVAARGDSLWVAARSLSGSAVLRVRPAGGDVAATIPIEGSVFGLAVGDGDVWAAAGRNQEPATLTRIDAETGAVTATIDLGDQGVGNGAEPLAVAAGTAWVATGNTLTRVDTETLEVTPIAIPRNEVYSVAADATGVWIAVGDQPGQVLRIDPATNAVIATVDLARATVSSIAAGDGAVWAF